MAVKGKTKMAPPANVEVEHIPSPKISISFYFERNDDEFGFDRIVVNDMAAIKNRYELDAIEGQIMALESRRYTKVSIISVIPLED